MSKTLDLRALRAFVVAAQEGNISRAADKLRLSQPAVSLQLKQLGRITGLELFTRMPKGVLLTRFTYRVVAPPGWEPQVRGREWPELVRLPWILTPPASVHHRLLAAVLEPLGLRQNGVAQVDQEASMLALVRSGVGLCLARDSQAIHESQAHGLAVADRVALDAVLGFVCLQHLRHAGVVQCAFDALARVWRAAGS